MSVGAFSERVQRLVGFVVSSRYQIHAVVSESSTGARYVARRSEDGHQVTIDTVHPEVAARVDTLARIEREVLVGRHVQHAHLAAAQDAGALPDGTRYLVLEYLPGFTLRQILTQGPLAADRAVTIAEQLARALDALHDASIVHANLTPEVVMVMAAPSGGDLAKLTSFGNARLPAEMLAKAGSESVSRQRMMTPVSTRGSAAVYCAPEMIAGKTVGNRSDLYSLGILLFEMCTGAPPPLGGDPPPVSHLCPGAPAGLDEIARELLSREASHRPPNAQDVARALSGLTVRQFSSPALPSLAAPAMTGLGAGGAGLEPVAADTPTGPMPVSIMASVAGIALIAAVVIGTAIGRDEPFKGDQFSGYDARESADDDDEDDGDGAGESEGRSSGAAAGSSSTGGLPSIGLGGDSAKKKADPFEVNKLVAQFNKEHGQGKVGASLDTLKKLIELEPDVVRKSEIRPNIIGLCDRVMKLDTDTQQQLYELLTDDLGPLGYDILWQLITTKGGSKSANLAKQLLDDPLHRKRAGHDVQIAYALRYSTDCASKLPLYEQARKSGGRRTSTELARLQQVVDRPRYKESCPGHKDELRSTIAAVQARTR